MNVNSVSPGSYNSPSVQPEVTTRRTQEEEAKRNEEKQNPPPPIQENNRPTVNSNGQTVGSIINTKA